MFALLIELEANKIQFRHLVSKENDKWVAHCIMTERIDYIFDNWEQYKHVYLDNITDVKKGLCGFMKKMNANNYTAIDHIEYKEGKELFLDWIDKKRLII